MKAHSERFTSNTYARAREIKAIPNASSRDDMTLSCLQFNVLFCKEKVVKIAG